MVLIWNSPTHVTLVASYRLPGRNVSLRLHVDNIHPWGTPFSTMDPYGTFWGNMNPCWTPWIRTSRVTRASWASVRHSFHIVHNIWNKQRSVVTYNIGNNLTSNVILSFLTIPCNWMKMPYPLLLFVPFDFYNYSILSIFLATIARTITLLDRGSGDLTGSAQFCTYDPIFSTAGALVVITV